MTASGGHLPIHVVHRYLDGSLGDELRAHVRTHIEACDECRALLLAASSLMTRAPAGGAERSGVLPTVPEEHYVIEQEIARGGLGKIFSARHLPLDRVVAVKELIDTDDAHRRRFVREALVTASLQHPGIVPVHEAGRWPSGEPFYAMKLVAGESLQHVFEHTVGLNARLALLPRLIAVGEALAYAHERGVIHRGRNRRRHAALHVARAGQGAPGRRSLRRVFARRGALRALDRKLAVRGSRARARGDGRRRDRQAHSRRQDRSGARARAGGAARPRDHHRARAGRRSGGALSLGQGAGRGSRAIRRRPAHLASLHQR